ncbi:MAG: hypothetical protein R3E79_57065 [Caldilineaceae bacterium]
MKQRNRIVWAGYMIGWLLLVGVATVVAWQAHITTLYVAALLLDHPTLRPTGWSSSTLIGISKLSVIGWGALWLIATSYLEYQLRESIADQRLGRQWLRFLLFLLMGLLLFYLPTRL